MTRKRRKSPCTATHGMMVDVTDDPQLPLDDDEPARSLRERTSARASDAFGAGRERMSDAVDAGRERMSGAVDAGRERVVDAVDVVGGKVGAAGVRAVAAVDATAVALHVPIPIFRGLLHLVAAIGAIAAGIVLVLHAHAAREHVAAAVFSTGLLLTFATSAVYHRTPVRRARLKRAMRKADHSMIFVLIVSSFTPFALVTMRGDIRWISLATLWGMAAIGITIRMFWNDVPRGVLVSTYLGLGWGCAAFSPWLAPHLAVVPAVLLGVCGLLYSMGAIVYARKRPNPLPRVFGFHEIFHAFTIAAAACNWVAVWMVLA